MILKLGLSRIFWIASAFTYLFLAIVMYALLTFPESTFDAGNRSHVIAAAKLSYFRISIVAVAMIIHPIILFSSLKYAKYFTILLTAWAIAMYIDDHLVLYSIIEYPSRGIVVFLLSIRPIFLACLIWMSFELTFTKSKAR